MKKLFVALFMVTCLAACATNSTIFNIPLNQSELDSLVKNSPVVRRIASVNYDVVSNPESVKLYFKSFNFLNQPDLIDNWQHYYVLGKSSNPVNKYERIAEIEIYLPDMNDSNGVGALKEAASKIGATALIDVYKKPLTATGNVRQVGYSKTEHSIDTYLYYGLAIREK